MKSVVSRVVSLVLALAVLMLPVAALAEEHNMYTLTVGNFVVSANGETLLSLPVSVALGLGVDEENERGALLAQILSGDKVAATAVAALENNEIRANLSGMNRSVYAPLEQVLALVEEVAGEMIGDVSEDLMDEVLDSVAQEKLAVLMAAIEAMANDPEVGAPDLDAIGISYADAGMVETALFEDTVTAQKITITMKESTLAELTAAMGEAVQNFANAYMDFLFYLIAQELGSDEDMPTVEEALTLLSYSLDGALYLADDSIKAEGVLNISADGETLAIPVTFLVLEGDDLTRMELIISPSVDGETVELDFYCHVVDTDDMTLYFSAAITMYDAESGDIYESAQFEISAVDGNEPILAVALTVDDGIEPVVLGFMYAGADTTSATDPDSWKGTLLLHASSGDESYQLEMDTCLTASTLPAGQLVPSSDADVNLMEASEDDINALSGEALTAVMQALGVLMETPEIAEIISGMMM